MVNRYVHVYILCVYMFVCVYVWIRTCKYMHMHANLSARVRRHAYTCDSLVAILGAPDQMHNLSSLTWTTTNADPIKILTIIVSISFPSSQYDSNITLILPRYSSPKPWSNSLRSELSSHGLGQTRSQQAVERAAGSATIKHTLPTEYSEFC